MAGERLPHSKQKEMIDQQIRVNIHPVHHKSGTIYDADRATRRVRFSADTYGFPSPQLSASGTTLKFHGAEVYAVINGSKYISLEFDLPLPFIKLFDASAVADTPAR